MGGGSLLERIMFLMVIVKGWVQDTSFKNTHFLWSGSIGSPLGFPELEQPPKIKMVERGKTSWSCLSPPSVREVENQVSGETDTPFALSCLGPTAGFAAEAPVKVPQGGPSPWDASPPARG